MAVETPDVPESITVRTKRDIIDFVNSHPAGTRRTKILVFIALGGIFVDAYDFTSLGFGVDAITEQFQLVPWQVGTMTGVMAVGALLGAFLGGYLVDKIGRYKLFVLDLILFVVAAIGAALAPNLITLLIFRFLLGFGVGVDMPVSFSFIAEFTNKQSKGKYVNFWQSMWYIAVVSAGIVVLPFYFGGAGGDLWRWAVGFGAVPALIVLLLRLKYTEESPMWAAHRLGLHEAAKILEKSYGITVVVEAAEGQEAVKKLPNLSALFKKKYRGRTVLASVISGTQSMEYYAVGFYVPTIVALILGKGVLFAIIGTIVINLFGVLGGTTQPFLTARWGTRKLAITGYTIVVSCLLLLGLVGETVPGMIAALLVGVLIFGHSFGPGAARQDDGGAVVPHGDAWHRHGLGRGHVAGRHHPRFLRVPVDPRGRRAVEDHAGADADPAFRSARARADQVGAGRPGRRDTGGGGHHHSRVTVSGPCGGRRAGGRAARC